MKRLILALFVMTAGPLAVVAQPADAPKNVILFISDGCGPASFTFAREYLRATTGDRAMPQAFFNLGEILFAQERYDEAIESYRAFVALWNGDREHAGFAKGRIAACEKLLRKRERDRAP